MVQSAVREKGRVAVVLIGPRHFCQDGTEKADRTRERQRRAAAAAWDEVRRCVPVLLLPLVRRMVKSGGQDGANREMAKSVLVRMGDVTRKVILAVGRELAERGWLAASGDVGMVTALLG